MSDKAGKESQYMFSRPEPGLNPSIGSDRESGCDKLVSEPRFRLFWKSRRLRCTYIVMCLLDADVFVLCIV